MTLRTKAICKTIYEKTNRAVFKELMPGDIIEFSTELKRAGIGSHGTYATYIRCFNPKTNNESSFSFNQIANILECFEFEEI